MYHYVRPGPNAPPYEYYYLDLQDFRRQLDHFEAEYELISREQFLDCVAGHETPPSDGIILTFDDGLLDHYEYVLPELRSRNLWGLFFVPGPRDANALSVHRVHTLLGTASTEALAEVLEQVIDRRDIREERREEFQRMYDDSSASEAVTQIKRTLNYLLPYDRVPEVLTELEEQFPDARADPSELYMSRNQIGELAAAGMLVGGHTVTHKVLSRLSPADQRQEVTESLAYAAQAAGDESLRTFAYPYGTAETFDGVTLARLREAGCDLSFTTEPGAITAEALSATPLQLPRYDCNEFPHGEASRR